MDQNCAIACVDCTVLTPETTPCPTCGGSGTQIVGAQMCNEAIQKGYGEKSRREYQDFKKALAKQPGDAELLTRLRAWIRDAVAYSQIYPAWSAAFKNVTFPSDPEGFQSLRTEVQQSLRKHFEESGRLLER